MRGGVREGKKRTKESTSKKRSANRMVYKKVAGISELLQKTKYMYWTELRVTAWLNSDISKVFHHLEDLEFADHCCRTPNTCVLKQAEDAWPGLGGSSYVT